MWILLKLFYWSKNHGNSGCLLPANTWDPSGIEGMRKEGAVADLLIGQTPPQNPGNITFSTQYFFCMKLKAHCFKSVKNQFWYCKACFRMHYSLFKFQLCGRVNSLWNCKYKTVDFASEKCDCNFHFVAFNFLFFLCRGCFWPSYSTSHQILKYIFGEGVQGRFVQTTNFSIVYPLLSNVGLWKYIKFEQVLYFVCCSPDDTCMTFLRGHVFLQLNVSP